MNSNADNNSLDSLDMVAAVEDSQQEFSDPLAARLSMHMEQLYESSRRVSNGCKKTSFDHQPAERNANDTEDSFDPFATKKENTSGNAAARPLGSGHNAEHDSRLENRKESIIDRGLVPAPDLCSLVTSTNVNNAAGSVPKFQSSFSCFTLSGDMTAGDDYKADDANVLTHIKIGSSFERPRFDMPSQVLPAELGSSGPSQLLGDLHIQNIPATDNKDNNGKDDAVLLMPPPSQLPSRLSQDEIPLSIPNHFDNDGNLLSLKRVVEFKRPHNLSTTTVPPDNVNQTPKLHSASASSLKRDDSVTFKKPLQTPVLNVIPRAVVQDPGTPHIYPANVGRLRDVANYERTPVMPSLDVSLYPVNTGVAQTPVLQSLHGGEDDSMPYSLEIVQFKSDSQYGKPSANANESVAIVKFDSTDVTSSPIVCQPAKMQISKTEPDVIVQSLPEPEMAIETADEVIVENSYDEQNANSEAMTAAESSSGDIEALIDDTNIKDSLDSLNDQTNGSFENFSVPCSLPYTENNIVDAYMIEDSKHDCIVPESDKKEVQSVKSSLEGDFESKQRVYETSSEFITDAHVKDELVEPKESGKKLNLDYQPSQIFDFDSLSAKFTKAEEHKSKQMSVLESKKKKAFTPDSAPYKKSSTSTPNPTDSKLSSLEKFMNRSGKTPSSKLKLVSVPITISSATAPQLSKRNPNETKNESMLLKNSIFKVDDEETQETLPANQPSTDLPSINDIVAAYEDKSRCLSLKKSRDANDNDSSNNAENLFVNRLSFAERKEEVVWILDKTSLKDDNTTIRVPGRSKKHAVRNDNMHPEIEQEGLKRTPRRIVLSDTESEAENDRAFSSSPLVRHAKIVDLSGSQDLCDVFMNLDDASPIQTEPVPVPTQGAEPPVEAEYSSSHPLKRKSSSFAIGDRVWGLSRHDDAFYPGWIKTVFFDCVFGIEFDSGQTDHLAVARLSHMKLEAGDMVQFKNPTSKEYEGGIVSSVHEESFIITSMNRKLFPDIQLREIKLLPEDMELIQSKRQILKSRPGSALGSIGLESANNTPVKKTSSVHDFVAIPPVPASSSNKRKSELKNERPEFKKAKRTPALGNPSAIISPQTAKRTSEMQNQQTLSVESQKHSLFGGYQFLLTGLSDKPKSTTGKPLAERLKEFIEISGGEVVNIEDVDRTKRMPKECILIASKPCRTTKYFFALAKGIPRLNDRWITDSAKRHKIVQMCKYELPNGFDDLEHEVPPKRTCSKIFNGQRIYIYAPKLTQEEKNYWSIILRTAGGELVLKQNSPNISYCVSFAETISQKSSSLRNPEIFISKEWLFQCLIQQKLLDIDNERYQLGTTVIQDRQSPADVKRLRTRSRRN